MSFLMLKKLNVKKKQFFLKNPTVLLRSKETETSSAKG